MLASLIAVHPLTAIVLVLFLINLFVVSVWRMQRNVLFSALAQTFALRLTLDYQAYPFWTTVKPYDSFAIRTLAGTLNGATILIQDRVRPPVLFIYRVLPIFLWPYIYMELPTTLFHSGASTELSVNGVVRETHPRLFWSISSFAKASYLDHVLQSFAKSPVS
jgi:hypothetical protein